MKNICLIIFIALTTLGFSQSNKKGTFQIYSIGGLTVAGKDITKEVTSNQTLELKSSFFSIVTGTNLHYGISNKISIGLGFNYSLSFLRLKKINGEEYTYRNSNFETINMNILNLNLQSKYFVINKDDFNMYGGLNLGLAKATNINNNSLLDNSRTLGLYYCLNTGLNYYFVDFMGLNFQLGYDGYSLSGEKKYENNPSETKVTRNLSGINIMGGFVFKVN